MSSVARAAPSTHEIGRRSRSRTPPRPGVGPSRRRPRLSTPPHEPRRPGHGQRNDEERDQEPHEGALADSRGPGAAVHLEEPEERWQGSAPGEIEGHRDRRDPEPRRVDSGQNRRDPSLAHHAPSVKREEPYPRLSTSVGRRHPHTQDSLSTGARERTKPRHVRPPHLAPRCAARPGGRNALHIGSSEICQSRGSGGVSEQARTGRWPMVLVAGAVIGLIEAVFAVAFASLVFGGRIVYHLAEGIGLYLGAAFLTLAILAWRAGKRGVVGSLQATGAVLLSIVAATTSLTGSTDTGFLSVVAAAVVVTVLCGVVFLVLGVRRRGDLIRYIPVPVVGGFIAGAGWLLLLGGIHMAIEEPLFYTHLDEVFEGEAVRLWLPTVAFGVVLLLAVRIVRKPLVIPVTIGIGLVGFALVALAMGASIEDVRGGGWLLGPFKRDMAWKIWSFLALAEADWLAVARSWAAIVVAVVVAALVMLFNLVSGPLGGIPGYHALNLTSLAARMNVDARRAGLVAATVPLAALLFGATVLELLPRMIVGGMLVFLGLSFIAEWVWERRRSLPRIEYAVVVVILAVVVARGYLPGIVVGLVLAVGLFAVSYGRVDLVQEGSFGEVYRSTVDRPPAERERLRALADRVQILRVSGYVFFGSANRLLERIRARVEGETP